MKYKNKVLTKTEFIVMSILWDINHSACGHDILERYPEPKPTYKVNVYVTRLLTLTASAEDNYNSLTAENRHAWFGDASARLKLKHVDLELQLNNLFDQRQYTRVSYSGLDIYTHTSQLRPRNIIGTIRFKLL